MSGQVNVSSKDMRLLNRGDRMGRVNCTCSVRIWW